MTDHYDTLGVPRDADSATIKRAYRKRARETHPDHGGDTDEAASVNGAYMVLIDPEKRARYDRTGKDEAPRNELAMAMDVAGQFFDKAVAEAGNDIATRSLIGDAQRMMDEETAAGQRATRSVKDSLARTEKVIGRLTHKGKGPNFLLDRLKEAVRKQEQDIALNTERLALLAKARGLLDTYDFETDPLPDVSTMTGRGYNAYRMAWDLGSKI